MSITKHIQKGEISLTLSLLGIFMALIGVGLGVVSVQQQVTTSTSAQLLPGDYPYSSRLEIRNVDGKIIAWQDGIEWTNFIQGGTNPGATNGDVKDVACSGTCPAELVWNTGSVPQSLRDTTAGVQIRFPEGYEVVDTFCESGPRDMCENISTNQDGPRLVNFQNLKIQKDTQVYYGVVVRGGSEYTAPSQPEPTNPPGENPPPPGTTGNMEVQVVAMNYPQVTEYWNSDHAASRRPASCSRQGPTEEQRPLYLSDFTIRAECTGGGCQVGQRHEVEVEKSKGYANLYNLPAGEYKLDIKDVNDRGFREYAGCEDRRWTVTANQTTQEPMMMLSNFQDGEYETKTTESNCKSDGGKPNLIQGIGGNLCYYPNGRTGGGGGGDEPSDPGSLQCSRLCIYSQGTPENFKCYEGICPADRPDCGGNTPKERIDNGNKGCAYGLDACGVQAYEVSCTTGERIGAEVPPGNPVPPVPNPTVPPINRDTTAMAFQPGSFEHPTIKVGDTIEVNLYLNTPEKVYRTIAQVGFDSDLVEVVDSYATTPGTQVQRGNFPDISDGKGKQISNTVTVNEERGTGVISYGVERFAPFGGQTGVDIVFRATFKAKKAGKVDLTFKGRTVMNEQAQRLNVQTLNGWFTVEGDSQPEPEKIFTFTTTNKNITKGSKTNLVWNTKNASRVTLDGVSVAKEGSKEVSPTSDSRYTMRVVWPDGTSEEKTVDIKVVSGGGTPAPPPPAKGGNCKSIKGTGEKVVVFMPQGFDDMSEFEKIVQHHAKDLSKTNIRELDEKYISYKINSRNLNYRCSALSGGSAICNFLTVQLSSLECGGMVGVVIVNDDDTHIAVSIPPFSTIVLSTSALNRTDGEAYTLAHELGHGLVGLYDEYVLYHPAKDSRKTDRNCSPLIEAKCTWGDRAECIAGCGTPDWYRPSEHSIMNYELGLIEGYNVFNQPSVDRWRKILPIPFPLPLPGGLTSLSAEDAKNAYHNAIKVNITQQAENILVVDDVTNVSLYPEKPVLEDDFSFAKYYKVQLLDDLDNVLFVTYKHKDDFSYHMTEEPQFNEKYELYLPYYEQATTITVQNEVGTEILNESLDAYNLGAPEAVTDLCGNAVCDAALGEDALSCRADCGPHLALTELERADLDGNGIVNTQDLAFLLDDEVYQSTLFAEDGVDLATETLTGDVDGDLRINALDYTLVLKWLGFGTEN